LTPLGKKIKIIPTCPFTNIDQAMIFTNPQAPFDFWSSKKKINCDEREENLSKKEEKF
jgi:hypothetical protein